MNSIHYESIRIEITGQCNLRCIYCHANKLNSPEAIKKELSKEQIFSIIDQAREIGIKEYTLIGGEPFLNDDIFEIISKCGSNSEVYITTNGTFLNSMTLDRMNDFSQIKQIRISIDGLVSHDEVRVGSSYIDIINNIKLLKSTCPSISVVIQTTCNKQNMNELINLYDILKTLDISDWRINQLWKVDSKLYNEDILEFPSYEALFDVYVQLINKYKRDNCNFHLSIFNVYNSDISSIKYEELNLNTHPCSYHFHSLSVKADGKMTFCSALDIPFGNLKEEALKDILSTDGWYTNYKKLKIIDLPCDKCRYLKLCGGGCRAEALAWAGSLHEVDLVSCSMMPFVERKILPILSIKEKFVYESLINYELEYPIFAGNSILEAAENLKSSSKFID